MLPRGMNLRILKSLNNGLPVLERQYPSVYGEIRAALWLAGDDISLLSLAKSLRRFGWSAIGSTGWSFTNGKVKAVFDAPRTATIHPSDDGSHDVIIVLVQTADTRTIAQIEKASGGKPTVVAEASSASPHLLNERQTRPTAIEYAETYTMTVTSVQVKDALGNELVSRIKDWMTLGVSGFVEKLEELARHYDDIGKNPTAPFVKHRVSGVSVRLPMGWVLQGEIRGKLVLAGNNFDQETIRKFVNNERAVVMIQFKRYVHNVFGTIAQRDSMTVEEVYNMNKPRIPYTAPMTEEHHTCGAESR